MNFSSNYNNALRFSAMDCKRKAIHTRVGKQKFTFYNVMFKVLMFVLQLI